MTTLFRIFLPTGLTGFGPDCALESVSRDWLQIMGGEAGYRSGEIVNVPDQIFGIDRRVNDERAYRIGRNGSIYIDHGEVEAGSVVLLLESPHKDEFDGPRGRAVGPLRNPAVRAFLAKHLPALIRDTESRLGRSLEGMSVTLANAVQYQASLQSLMKDYYGPLRSGVRTPVWNAIFRSGGRVDLVSRLDSYKPSVVLVAPTGKVRSAVQRAITPHMRTWPWIDVSYHPSYWGRRVPKLIGALNPAS